MINKNVSMDFEALKRHARMNYWEMGEVGPGLFEYLKPIPIFRFSCSSASRGWQITPSHATQWLDPGLVEKDLNIIVLIRNNWVIE